MAKMRLRLSIRYKMLLTIMVVLLLAIGTYLYLATSLFTEDKLTYVYDLNSLMVETLSEQTQSNLNVTTEKLSLFTRDVITKKLPDEERDQVVKDFFSKENDILRIEIASRGKTEDSFKTEGEFVNPQLMEEVGLDRAALLQMRNERPLPFEAIAAEKGRLYLKNSSLPPDSAVLTLAISHQSEIGSVVVAADFLHQRLLRIFGKSKLHETYLVDESGEILAHPDAKKVIGRVNLAQHNLVSDALQSNVSRGVMEFRDDDDKTMLGAYAKVDIGRLVVATQISKKEALRANRELIRRSIYFAIGILAAAFMVSIVFARYLTAPIGRLRAASETIGKGSFDVAIDVKSRDEIGDLARTFERMAAELKETQSQLVFSEKMAAFGQLGAGITHEVKNPITGIVGFAQLGQANIDNKEKIKEYFEIIQNEGLRCSDILVNFLKFVRQDTDDVGEIEINKVVQETAKIINHQLQIHSVQLKVELDEGAHNIMGNAAKLQQVLLNLSINAQQAMSEGGAVTLTTARDGTEWVDIIVSDDGPGIPEDIRQQIFDPFFTTKPPGEGTGLGLSIVFGIIRDHGGTISVESEMGKGTTFTIHLPQTGS